MEEAIKRLEAFHMRIWEKMERISSTENVANKEVLRKLGEIMIIGRDYDDCRRKNHWLIIICVGLKKNKR